MSADEQLLKWSSSYTVAPASRTPKLPGDKILLPQSALEGLLAAAPIVTSDASSHPVTSTFDPFNPYTYAAERAARAITQDRQQQLPHPLTFRLVSQGQPCLTVGRTQRTHLGSLRDGGPQPRRSVASCSINAILAFCLNSCEKWGRPLNPASGRSCSRLTTRSGCKELP